MKDKSLFRTTKKEYGEKYHEHLFSQYQKYIDGIERVSDRRQNANSFFITINTAILTLIGVSNEINKNFDLAYLKSLLAFMGILVCIIFWHLIRSYKQLNTGKFKVVHKIENYMPLALYEYEWKVLGEGKNDREYYPFSHIELLIPWVYGVIYLILGIVSFIK